MQARMLMKMHAYVREKLLYGRSSDAVAVAMKAAQAASAEGSEASGGGSEASGAAASGGGEGGEGSTSVRSEGGGVRRRGVKCTEGAAEGESDAVRSKEVGKGVMPTDSSAVTGGGSGASNMGIVSTLLSVWELPVSHFATFIPEYAARQGVTLLHVHPPHITIENVNTEISRFGFFHFSPTLIYRDSYPRSGTQVSRSVFLPLRGKLHTLPLFPLGLTCFSVPFSPCPSSGRLGRGGCSFRKLCPCCVLDLPPLRNFLYSILP
jgi:hypothetical protein